MNFEKSIEMKASLENEASLEAKEEFYSWLESAAGAKNEQAEKIPSSERRLEPFENIGFIDKIRPSSHDKVDNIFVCDFDDTIFDTTGHHNDIAARCQALNIPPDEWHETYELAKKEKGTAGLYDRNNHIKELQLRYPQIASGIAEAFNNTPLGPRVDSNIMAVINLVAARSDSKVIILTRGDVATQELKLRQIPELEKYASMIAYTQTNKKEFLECFSKSKFFPKRQKMVYPARPHGNEPINNPHMFLLDDSPDETSDFINLGKKIYFQALRLRLPRAKRFAAEQKGGRVLESTDIKGNNYKEDIYTAFVGFIDSSTCFRPGGNFSQVTLGATKKVDYAAPYKNAKKYFAENKAGEIENWSAGYKSLKQTIRYNQTKKIIERKNNNGLWSEYPLDKVLSDEEFIF